MNKYLYKYNMQNVILRYGFWYLKQSLMHVSSNSISGFIWPKTIYMGVGQLCLTCYNDEKFRQGEKLVFRKSIVSEGSDNSMDCFIAHVSNVGICLNNETLNSIISQRVNVANVCIFLNCWNLNFNLNLNEWILTMWAIFSFFKINQVWPFF